MSLIQSDKKESGGQHSQVEQVLDSILGTAKGYHRAEFTEGSFLVSTRTGNPLSVEVHFYYGSGAPEAVLKTDTIPYRDLRVFGRETLQKIGVIF